MENDGGSSVNVPKTFHCRYCPRRFHIPQAFSGHQNAHKRDRAAYHQNAHKWDITTTDHQNAHMRDRTTDWGNKKAYEYAAIGGFSPPLLRPRTPMFSPITTLNPYIHAPHGSLHQLEAERYHMAREARLARESVAAMYYRRRYLMSDEVFVNLQRSVPRGRDLLGVEMGPPEPDWSVTDSSGSHGDVMSDDDPNLDLTLRL